MLIPSKGVSSVTGARLLSWSRRGINGLIKFLQTTLEKNVSK